MMTMKCRMPFRLGATSYVIAGDLAENLRYLAPLVDDMQLLLFDTGEWSNMPTRREVDELRRISRDLGITASVHLPTSIELGSPDAHIRRASRELFARTADLTLPLEPAGYALHYATYPIPTGEVDAWIERESEELSSLLPMLPSPRLLALENVDLNFDITARLVVEHDLSVCIDIGHLVKEGVPKDEFVSAWRDRCPMMHIHSAVPHTSDHMSLAQMPDDEIDHDIELIRSLGRDVVVTMEVFEQEDFLSSLDAMARAAERMRG